MLIRRRSRRASQPQPAPWEVPAGIHMHLEMVRGELAGGQTQMELELANELAIGSDPACGIALRRGEAPSRQARVFLSEGMVYLENLCPPEDVTVNGAPLEGSQHLRSGNEIAATDGAVIRLKF